MKIRYGIDLGTTNSGIARIDTGETRILKSDTQKDTMPSCVMFDKKGAISTGDRALNRLKSDRLRATKNWAGAESNVFIEFKRAMGTDKVYESANAGARFTPDELSAQVLLALKSFTKDEERVDAVVVTVPAQFTINQNDATRRAANQAGFTQVELLQEPVAASMAYGLKTEEQDGLWLVFDFGGGTFDAALVSVEEGIMKVEDTEGDNHLGGTNLDYAIVDRIIVPYLERTYSIGSIVADDAKRRILRDAMKQWGEETKIQLSFNQSHNLLTDLGDIPGRDDDGEEFELELEIDQSMMREAVEPVFQQAINLCKGLLERRNLKGRDLTTLLLVGGPTYSPILRGMLTEQLTDKLDTSVDPMTVVARGAALYASTIDVSAELQEESRDLSKVQLSLSYEATTVETDELVTVKLLPDKTSGSVPGQLFIEFERTGGVGWSSDRLEIGEAGEVVEIVLEEGQPNTFGVLGFDGQGNKVEVEPSEFTIIQGTQVGSATMPYHFGIEAFSRAREQREFVPVPGLEKNSSLPAKGIVKGLQTTMDVRPGNAKDSITIPLYQGQHDSEGTRALYNEHVYDIVFTGSDIPVLVPTGTDLELTVEISRDQNVVCRVFVPAIEFDEEVSVPRDTVQTGISAEQLDAEIAKGHRALELLNEEGFVDDAEALGELPTRLEDIETDLAAGRSDYDRRMQVLGSLRKVLRQVDRLSDRSEWPKVESELKECQYRLEELHGSDGEAATGNLIDQLRSQVEEVIAGKDVATARKLVDTIRSQTFELLNEQPGFWLSMLQGLERDKDTLAWTDRRRANELIRQGIEAANRNPSVSTLRPIVQELFQLLPDEKRLKELGGTGVVSGA